MKFIPTKFYFLFFAVFAGIIFQASAQPLSASKLSAHLINAYTAGSSNIVAGHPRILKVLGDANFPSGMVQAMRNYKTIAPTGKIVARIYTPQKYFTNDNPALSANGFWNILSNSLNTISSSDRALIDYLEGPNEGDTPTLGYPSDNGLFASQWFNQFWTNLTPKIVAAGYKPCLGSIGVGNPGGTTSQMQQYLAAFVPALRQAKAAGGAWSYHAYTINYTTDLNEEIYYSLRYRQFYNFFGVSYPDLADMPLILTEGGVDFSGDPNTSGWQARGTQSDYQRWLNWFDKQMAADSYLLGCTLFQNGDPGGWSSFDLEPIADWLKNYLIAPTALPPAPTGFSAAIGNLNVTLTWTNAPLHPTTYNLKRSQISGGPYTIIATNISEGVRASTFTDTSVTNGGSYYYIVSAVNALGEGANSAQILARATGLPDVTITALGWTNNLLAVGSRIIFRATVKNHGSAATPTGLNKGIGVGFSVDGGVFFAYCGADENFSLAPGASAIFTANGPANAFTWTATPGNHTVVATVDDVDRFFESNESNNSFSTNVIVPPRILQITKSPATQITMIFETLSGKTYR
ncbi:MAG: CARDB domain-containing protein, partial [Limisphaerales bacterium]